MGGNPLFINIPVRGHFDLDVTLRSGQVFRWRTYASVRGDTGCESSYRAVVDLGGVRAERRSTGNKESDGYCGVIGGRAVLVARQGGFLRTGVDPGVKGTAPDAIVAAVRRYFVLDEDGAAIEDELSSRHPALREMVRGKPGLRILRQDPWECLVSFILSVHNNIPAIERTIEALCDMLGNPCGFGRRTYPSPSAVAEVEERTLTETRCGFRARFLLSAAQKIASGEVDLGRVALLPTPLARTELMRIPGIGRKVADCVLLFAYHRLEVFPVDVWVKRAMARLFPHTERMSPEEVAAEGERLFQPFAGYAQQYLYWFERSGARLSRTGLSQV